VSSTEHYFGTRDVGTSVTHQLKIANRGGDIYPLKSIKLEGSNADEFSTEAINDVVLNPTEMISIGVSFQPISNGRKFADFTVNYDTIKQVSDEANQNEQNYYEGREFEKTGRYAQAKQRYSQYMEGEPVTSNKRRAAIKLPVIQESEIYGNGKDFSLYLSAIEKRDNGQYDVASTELEVISTLYADGYLGDDALYLKGYIQLMDEKDYPAALQTMQTLRKQYPDSTYYDTALYSEAISHIELGNVVEGREILLDLRYRHTGIDTLGIKMPKDNLVSRLWFERTTDVLEELDAV